MEMIVIIIMMSAAYDSVKFISYQKQLTFIPELQRIGKEVKKNNG